MRAQVEEMISTYEQWRKSSISSFDTVKSGWDGIKGIGDSINSITDALDGNGAFSSLPTIMTLYVVPLLYDLLFKKPPLNIDVGSDDLDDTPDDAAEYIAQSNAQPEA